MTIIYLIFFMVGLASIIVGVISYRKAQSLLNNGKQAIGTVIEIETSFDSDGVTYAPIIAYENTLGHRKILRSDIHSYPSRYKLGDNVPILYNPENYQLVRINKFVDLYLVTLLFTTFGTIFLFISLGYALYCLG